MSKKASNTAYAEHEEGARTDLVWAIFPPQKEDLGCGVRGKRLRTSCDARDGANTRKWRQGKEVKEEEEEGEGVGTDLVCRAELGEGQEMAALVWGS